MSLFSVFYLVGGSANFVCKSVVGKFSFENAQKEVEKLQKMGFKSMSVKNGHIVGGYCSNTDFQTTKDSNDYYDSLN